MELKLQMKSPWHSAQCVLIFCPKGSWSTQPPGLRDVYVGSCKSKVRHTFLTRAREAAPSALLGQAVLATLWTMV
jgi:hypothetical protein